MSSSQSKSSELHATIMEVKAVSEGDRNTPAIVLAQAWELRHGFVDVVIMSDFRGEDWHPSDDVGYIKGVTTWPEQHAACLPGLTIKCIMDSKEPYFVHACGLMQQETNVQALFTRRLIHFRYPENKPPKFPKMNVEINESGGLCFDLPSSCEEAWVNARDKRSGMWKDVIEELETLVKNTHTGQPYFEKSKTSHEGENEEINKIKVKARIDERHIFFIDRLAEDWGFGSRGEVINKLLTDLFDEDSGE